MGVFWMRARFDDLFGRKQSLNVLEIDPRAGGRLDIVKAKGRELTSAVARRAGALAAINGGYFEKNGDPDGYLKVDGKFIEGPSYAGQVGFGIDRKGRVTIGELPPGDWSKAREAIGVGPMLNRGKSVVDHGDKQRKVRHPRTALGLRKDGSIVWIVADGRTPNAAGLSFEELGALFVGLGCVRSMNLDGGGSSVLWLRGRGQRGVVSHPSDNKRFDHGGERKVGSIVLLHAPAVFVLDDAQAVFNRDRAELPKRLEKAKGVFGSSFAWFGNGGAVEAKWSLDLTARSFEVFARWPKLRGRDAGAATLHAPGLEAPLDQRLRAGRWVSIGRLTPTQAGRVALVQRGRAGRPLAVDALRLVERSAGKRSKKRD